MIVGDSRQVTLLLFNSMANEALPIFLAELVPGWVAILLSVTLVLFFGEIIPSAIFLGETPTMSCLVKSPSFASPPLSQPPPSTAQSHKDPCYRPLPGSGPRQINIAARLSGVAYFLMAIFFPIASPIAWLLDRLLGIHGLKRYTREEVRSVQSRDSVLVLAR
jgi:CBS domain containing-hemolysin-like protein